MAALTVSTSCCVCKFFKTGPCNASTFQLDSQWCHYHITSRLCRCNETAISLKAGCQLFLRYTTRTSALDAEDFEAAKRRIIEVRCPRPLNPW